MRYVQIILFSLLLAGCVSTNWDNAKITQPELYEPQSSDCYTEAFAPYRDIYQTLNYGAKVELSINIIAKCN